jgi:hypothetical protein
MQNANNWQCRIASSLGGGFAGTPNEVWGTVDYTNDTDPAVFFGLYGFPDFCAFWQHKGEKAILWAGSDIRHFVNGYWLDTKGDIRLDHKALAQYLKQFPNYVENEVEQSMLHSAGIHAHVVPSFLGDISTYDLSFSPGNKVYTSVSGDDFDLYGWNEIPQMAFDNPDIEFHLYGNTKEWPYELPNVVVHGRVPQEQMNAEIQKMQGALRLTKFDGFSEIIAKSLLWGQYPVSPYIPYSYALMSVEWIKSKTEPNIMGRDHYLKIINEYPWNVQKHS